MAGNSPVIQAVFAGEFCLLAGTGRSAHDAYMDACSALDPVQECQVQWNPENRKRHTPNLVGGWKPAGKRAGL